MREIIKVVKEKLVAKYLKDGSIKNYSKRAKKFKPRIKARIRKNKRLIVKNIDNFFDWIKNYNDCVCTEWDNIVQERQSEVSEEDAETVDNFVDVELEDDAKK